MRVYVYWDNFRESHLGISCSLAGPDCQRVSLKLVKFMENPSGKFGICTLRITSDYDTTKLCWRENAHVNPWTHPDQVVLNEIPHLVARFDRLQIDFQLLMPLGRSRLFEMKIVWIDVFGSVSAWHINRRSNPLINNSTFESFRARVCVREYGTSVNLMDWTRMDSLELETIFDNLLLACLIKIFYISNTVPPLSFS